MASRSREQQYVLPAKVVHFGVFALFTSLVLNGLGTIFYTYAATRSTTNYSFTDGSPARAPITPDTVALEVVDSERYGMHDDNDWNSVTPLGHGFVKVGDKGDFYAISMYHQLHCMNGFRKMLRGQQHSNSTRHAHDEAHIEHCLSYMRQMVLCAADTTLEPAFIAKNTDGRKTTAAYGSGVTHQCKDWVQIRNWAESNYEEWKDEAKDFAASEANTVHSD